MAKIHALPITKSCTERSTIPGEILFIDISYHKSPSPAGSKYWLLVVDDATDFSWSLFMPSKSDTSKCLIPLLQQIKNCGTPTKIFRCDNSSENTKLNKNLYEKGLDTSFQYTAPGTPQQNGRMDRKFSVIYDQIR
jgi:hypothetical protein